MKSRSDASDTNKPYSRTPGSSTQRREAVQQACSKASAPQADRETGGKASG